MGCSWAVKKECAKIQTKIESFVESAVNIFIGYTVAVISQIFIFPLFDIHVGIKTNLWIGVWFTVVSLVRSYAVRRVFNELGR